MAPPPLAPGGDGPGVTSVLHEPEPRPRAAADRRLQALGRHLGGGCAPAEPPPPAVAPEPTTAHADTECAGLDADGRMSASPVTVAIAAPAAVGADADPSVVAVAPVQAAGAPTADAQPMPDAGDSDGPPAALTTASAHDHVGTVAAADDPHA